MALYEFEGKRPIIGKGSFVPETADIIGDVVIGADCFIGVGARIRADYGRVRIGDRTSVQENVVIHARENEETVVGSNVQLGHGCILHTARVKDNAVIGVGAILTDYSVVGDWAIVGEGAATCRHAIILNLPRSECCVTIRRWCAAKFPTARLRSACPPK